MKRCRSSWLHATQTCKSNETNQGSFWRYMYRYIPRAPMTPIFEGQPPKTRPFPIKTRVIWVLGIYIDILKNTHSYTHTYTHYIFAKPRTIETSCVCFFFPEESSQASYGSFVPRRCSSDEPVCFVPCLVCFLMPFHDRYIHHEQMIIPIPCRSSIRYI